MGMSKKIKVVSLSGIAIMAAAAIIAAGTYALYSDEVTTHNHLVAGTTQLALHRTKLVSHLLDNNGFMTDVTDSVDVDFTAATTKTLFNLDEDAVIVPTQSATAFLELSNGLYEAHPSDTAFNWWLECELTTTSNELAEQLQLEVDLDPSTPVADYTVKLSDGLAVGSQVSPVATIKLGQKQAFTLKITFLDDVDNNLAKQQEVEFDVAIHAIQALEEL